MAYGSKNPKNATETLVDQGSASISSPPSGSSKLINRNNKLVIKNSSGVESLLGSGSGVKNYVLNPNDAYATWTASDSGVTVTTETTAANLPDNLTQTTGVKVLRVSGTTSYVRYRFTLDQADYNKKLQIVWDQAFAGAAGDFTIAVYSNTLANYTGTSTLITPSVTSIPSGTATFNTTFDSSGSTAPYMEVRIIAAAGTTPMYLNNVTVTPGQLVQGAAVSDWQTYTPTTQGFGTPTFQIARWRRVGSNMEIQIKLTTGANTGSTALIGLPSGYTGSAFGSGTGMEVGTMVSDTLANNSPYTAFVSGSTPYDTSMAFGRAQSALTALTGSAFVNSSILALQASIPIAEWAGSGTVNLGPGAQVEYAYNTDVSATGSVTASGFANGPSGVNVSGSWAVGTGYTRIVRFQYAKQDNDIVELEFNDGSGWVSATSYRFGTAIDQSTAKYGPFIQQINSTDFYVTFQTNGRAPDGATYSANGSAWSSLSTYKWRLRKSSASAPVGFGVATNTVTGLVKDLKTYRQGTTYNGVALTVANNSNLGSFTPSTDSQFIPYQTTDGSWHLRFTIQLNTTSSVTSGSFSIAGCSFKGATSGLNQACAAVGLTGPNLAGAYTLANTANVQVIAISATTNWAISGDVELNSKPTWAD